MDQEEKFIEETCGRKTPFRVPEGYFDRFADQLVQNLPEREPMMKAKVVELKTSRWHRYRTTVAAAACVCAVALTLGGYLNGRSLRDARAHIATETEQQARTNYSSADAMADYAMMDSEDMYALMAEADN